MSANRKSNWQETYLTCEIYGIVSHYVGLAPTSWRRLRQVKTCLRVNAFSPFAGHQTCAQGYWVEIGGVFALRRSSLVASVGRSTQNPQWRVLPRCCHQTTVP